MVNATTLDLRFRTHDVISSLERGETVIVTYRGKAKGVISPYRETTARKSKPEVMQHPFVGMLSDSETPVDDVMSRLRGGRFNDL